MAELKIKDKAYDKFVPVRILRGEKGRSAYEMAVSEGFLGSYEEFLNTFMNFSNKINFNRNMYRRFYVSQDEESLIRPNEYNTKIDFIRLQSSGDQPYHSDEITSSVFDPFLIKEERIEGSYSLTYQTELQFGGKEKIIRYNYENLSNADQIIKKEYIIKNKELINALKRINLFKEECLLKVIYGTDQFFTNEKYPVIKINLLKGDSIISYPSSVDSQIAFKLNEQENYSFEDYSIKIELNFEDFYETVNAIKIGLIPLNFSQWEMVDFGKESLLTGFSSESIDCREDDLNHKYYYDFKLKLKYGAILNDQIIPRDFIKNSRDLSLHTNSLLTDLPIKAYLYKKVEDNDDEHVATTTCYLSNNKNNAFLMGLSFGSYRGITSKIRIEVPYCGSFDILTPDKYLYFIVDLEHNIIKNISTNYNYCRFEYTYEPDSPIYSFFLSSKVYYDYVIDLNSKILTSQEINLGNIYDVELKKDENNYFYFYLPDKLNLKLGYYDVLLGPFGTVFGILSLENNKLKFTINDSSYYLGETEEQVKTILNMYKQENKKYDFLIYDTNGDPLITRKLTEDEINQFKELNIPLRKASFDVVIGKNRTYYQIIGYTLIEV